MKTKIFTKEHFRFGFTLIELLVVIAIIGLLASIVTASLNNARVKARDAKRLSDIKQIKSGLDLYFSHGSGYPDKATFDGAYSGNTLLSCGTIPILKVIQDPLYPTYSYDYQVAGNTFSGCGLATLRENYTISFRLERNGTVYTMDEDGQFSPALPSL